ncbi:BTB/POZ domain-containing protein 2-like [Panicum virgatum]|nr:BTB/POZ domain-containing protein 2-like [Panicum virgatum]
MSVYLLMDDEDEGGRAAGAGAGEDVHVMFSLMMRDVGGARRLLRYGKVAAAFRRKGDACGYERFVSREHFVDILKCDRFEIRCDLTVFPAGSQPEPRACLRGVVITLSSHPSPSGENAPPPPPPAPLNPSVGTPAPPPPSSASPAPSVGRAAPPPPPVRPAGTTTTRRWAEETAAAVGTGTARPGGRAPLSGLPADLGRLLATKEGADVEFEVIGGKIFAAHKAVLAARSSVFKDEFFGQAKEKGTSFVRISDMHPESFEALLHFMYTDSLPEMTMNSLKEGAVLAEDLLVAAGRYNLKDLKSLTEDKLCSHVGVSTVLLMLAMAEQYQCCKLKKMCLGFIGSRANVWAIMATNDIENLARSSPSSVKDVIMEILDTRMARSMRLIKACFFIFCFQMLLLVLICYS